MEKLTSPISNDHPSSDEAINKQRAFWAAIIFTFVAFASFVFALFLVSRTPIWQVYAIATITAVALAVDIIGTVLIWRGRVDLGLRYLFWSLMFTVPPNVLLVTNTTWILIAIVLLVGFIHVFYLHPRAWRKAYQFWPIIASFLMAMVEIFRPPFRENLTSQTTSSGYFGPIIFSLLVVSFIFLIVRQAWSGSLRSKLLAAFIGVTVIATGALGVFMYVTTSNNLRENLDRELTAQATDRATHIGNLLNEQVNALTTLSLSKALQDAVETNNKSHVGSAVDIQATLDALDERWRAANEADNNNDFLVQWYLTNAVARELIEYQQNFPDNVEVFVTDVYGGLVGMTNRTSDYYQADEGWWQAAYNNGEGAVYIGAPELDESSGAVAVQIALPLRNQDTGEIIGILRTTYIVSPLATILTEKVGQTGEADLYIPGEVITRFHAGEFGPGDVSEFKALQAVANQGLVEMKYEGTSSVVVQAPVQTLVGNPFVDKLGWVVVFHQQRDEAFAPINAATRGFLIVLVIVIALAAAVAFGFSLVLARPIVRLTTIAEEVSAGNLDSRAEVTTADEVGTLATAFNTMTSRLQETLQGLEQRVAERTRNLELAAEVGRSVSQVRELDVMLRDACERILEEFDLYYVQVYLTDPGQRNLVLEAGTGEVGAQLLGRGHSLPLNTGSINGRAAVEKRTIVISDTSLSATFRANVLLPETRGETSIPLIVADKVVGVLDMQTRQPGKLNEEVLPAFEALAGQLAVAVQNANLLKEAEQARAEVEAQARRLVRTGWTEYLDAIHKPEQVGFVFDRNEVMPLVEVDESTLSEDGRAVSAPIAVTGEMFGSLVVELNDDNRDEQTSELVNMVARQVAQQVENLRLLENAERYRFEAEQAARRQTQEGWQEYIRTKANENLGYLYDLNEVRPYNNGKDESSALTLPLKVRDETVGKLSIDGLTTDDKDSLELVNAIAERLGTHIESLRLTQQIQLRAQREQALRQITNSVRSSTNLTTIMRTAVRELGSLTGRRAVIRMTKPDQSNGKTKIPDQDRSSENADGGMN